MSQITNNMITDQDVSVLHQPSHVTDSNVSFITDVAAIINHVIDTQGPQETLDNSIHAHDPNLLSRYLIMTSVTLSIRHAIFAVSPPNLTLLISQHLQSQASPA